MVRYKDLPIDVYKRRLVIFIGSHGEFKHWVNDYFLYNKAYDQFVKVVLDSDDNAQASFWYNPNTGDNVIELHEFPEHPAQIACAAHEVLHAVIKLLDFVGVEFKQGGANEAYTYLLEYIMYNLLLEKGYKTY